MKTDAEVLLMRRERAKGKTQDQAAARAGMSVRTLRAYEQTGTLPSHHKEPRKHRTRPDPFAEDWTWIEQQLTRDPALQAITLFGGLEPGAAPAASRHARTSWHPDARGL